MVWIKLVLNQTNKKRTEQPKSEQLIVPTADHSDFGVVRLSDVRFSVFHCILFYMEQSFLVILQKVASGEVPKN